MIIALILAASLSLTSTNDYVYTVLASTNVVIAGVGMGENIDYSMMRFEDIAFLHEAWKERDKVAQQAAGGFHPGSTNIYLSTNIASYVIAKRHYELDSMVEYLTGSNRPGILLAEDQLRRLYTTDRAETNASYFADDHFNFREPFNSHLGYVDLVGTNGYHDIGFKSNFQYRYANLKRGKLIQTQGISRHKSDWHYINHELTDSLEYTWQTVEGWVAITNHFESTNTVNRYKGNGTFIGERSAYLRCIKFTEDDSGESEEGHVWAYTDAEYPSSDIPAYVDFHHSTNQEFEVVYIALDGEVSCTVDIYPFRDEAYSETIAKHRILYPLSAEGASIEEDKITFSFNADDIYKRTELAVGKVITPKKMREFLHSKMGGPPSEGGYYGNSNFAYVRTRLKEFSVILLLRVKWHARELENGE